MDASDPDPPVPPENHDAAAVASDRYCLTCRRPLTEDPDAASQRCDYCRRPWNPEVRGTWTAEPPLTDRASRFRVEPLARWSLLPLVLIGRVSLNLSWDFLATSLAGTGGRGRVGNAVAMILSVGTLLLAIPWVLLCALCFLIAISERAVPGFAAAAVIASLLGGFILIGYGAGAMTAGVLLGPFAALLFTRVYAMGN